jgi:hypothetical protein
MDKQVPVDPNAVAPDVEREGARPAAIVMTHGHFDHVGALASLAERWDVPIYAHPLELPYLDGRSSYPRRPVLVSAPRSQRGGRDDVGDVALLPARPRRRRPLAPDAAGGRGGAGHAGLALDPHAGAHAMVAAYRRD